jgi:hypothetical protein
MNDDLWTWTDALIAVGLVCFCFALVMGWVP